MVLDFGMVVVIAAVLVFYLRLILIQRQKAKLFRQAAAESTGKKKMADSKGKPDYSKLSMISARPRDRLIAAIGIGLMGLGVMLNLKIIPWDWGQPYWYLPVAAGILAFSWVFR